MNSRVWVLKSALLAMAVFLLICFPRRGAAAPRPASNSVVINLKAPTTPFPHYWERMFGSGRAVLAMRASYLRDLREVKQATGFDYVRFHGILNHGVGVFHLNAQGQPVYNFSYVDQIYDGLLARGVRPFVELSFMPPALSATPVVHQSFWYHPVVSPPKSWALWDELIQHLARHLIARYGIAEVSKWYFEVWNEPNLDFWAGDPKQATYFDLYDHTARALKEVSPLLRVGGPATAQSAWVPAFLDHVAKDHVPVDFVSTHIYGEDPPKNVFGADEKIPITKMVCMAASKVHKEVKDSPLPNLPIFYTEYNATFHLPRLGIEVTFVDGTDAEEIAAAVAFLASEPARYITGAVLQPHVDALPSLSRSQDSRQGHDVVAGYTCAIARRCRHRADLVPCRGYFRSIAGICPIQGKRVGVGPTRRSGN